VKPQCSKDNHQGTRGARRRKACSKILNRKAREGREEILYCAHVQDAIQEGNRSGVFAACAGTEAAKSDSSVRRDAWHAAQARAGAVSAGKGYWVFYPRWRGAWESDGEFLEKSPEQDLRDVMDELPKGVREAAFGQRFKLSPDEIFVIGGSFGGTAAILASRAQPS
jgi:hypothetical protein